MLSHLTSFLTGTALPRHPSTVLTLEAYPEIRALHIVPEDGTEELIRYSKEREFGYGGAKERSRELLGHVILHVSGGETIREFWSDVKQRVEQDPNLREQSRNGQHTAYHVNQALRSAALSCIQEMAKQESTPAAAQSYPVFLVQIDRAKAGKIMGEPRSISRW